MPMTGEKKREYNRQRYLRTKDEKANKLETKPIHISLEDNLDNPELLKAIDENIRTRTDERAERMYDIKVKLVDTLVAKGLTVKEASTLANEKSYGTFWRMYLDKLKLYLHNGEKYESQHREELISKGLLID